MAPPDPDTPLYSVAAVTQHTGVPAVTLRAWERRYGFPRPARAGAGRRLYSERDIWTVRELRAQTARGVPISRAIALLREADLPVGGQPPPVSSPSGPPLASLAERLVDAFVALAPARADALLSEALSQLSVEDVCLGVLQPALNEIGRRWHAGEATVGQEHFATAIVRARLGSLLDHALAQTAQPAVLAACPPDEWHELGLLMVCLFLARRGHSVRYLGANLPAEALVQAVRQAAPRLVVLSAQTEPSAARLIDVACMLRSLDSPRPDVAFGGWIFNSEADLRARVPGVFLGPDASTAVATIQRLLLRHPGGTL